MKLFVLLFLLFSIPSHACMFCLDSTPPDGFEAFDTHVVTEVREESFTNEKEAALMEEVYHLKIQRDRLMIIIGRMRTELIRAHMDRVDGIDRVETFEGY